MRRKLGILFLIGITVLAGTQEAARQFDGLKSSLKNFTRASLWSGLIVYAQPVSDGNLPTPQIYYLMPTPVQQPANTPGRPDAQPVLAASEGVNAPKPGAHNNHSAEAAQNPDAAFVAEAAREAEDAAKSELALNHLPLNLVASHLVAPKAEMITSKLEKARAYEEIAKNETRATRKFKYEFKHEFKNEGEALGGAFVKEAEAARVVAGTERIVVGTEQLVAGTEQIVAESRELERMKLKELGEAEGLQRRLELRVMRRPARTERPERIRIVPRVSTRGTAMLETSSVGCEKTRVTPQAAPAAPAAPAAAVAPLARTNARVLSAEPAIELGLPALSNPTGNSWTLNCDTEPEQK